MINCSFIPIFPSCSLFFYYIHTSLFCTYIVRNGGNHMNPNDDGYKILRDVQKKCHELNQKIDSMIRIMEVFTAYMQYSNKMADMDPLDVTQFMSEGSENMNPKDFQKIMNAAKNSDQPMSQDEFNQIFETLKQGKSTEEVARMEQMVQLAKSFMMQ